MKLTPLHAKYFAYELTKRYSSNSLEKFTAFAAVGVAAVLLHGVITFNLRAGIEA